MPDRTDPDSFLPLPASVMHIIVALADGEKHGYAIMRDVTNLSGGTVRMGSGTLYGSIKRMLQSGLIEELAGDHARRKYYALTDKGRKSLTSELQRYNDAVELARGQDLFKALGLI